MPPIEPPSKTVYILGAGFSAHAGGPNQNALMKLIAELPDDYARKTGAATFENRCQCHEIYRIALTSNLLIKRQ